MQHARTLGRATGFVLGSLVGVAVVAIQLWHLALYIAVRTTTLPYFGISGRDAMLGSHERRKGLVDVLTYDVRTRTLGVQYTVGKTMFTYTTFGVSPFLYIRYRRDPTPRSFKALFIDDSTRTVETIWRWRYDGTFRKGRRMR